MKLKVLLTEWKTLDFNIISDKRESVCLQCKLYYYMVIYDRDILGTMSFTATFFYIHHMLYLVSIYVGRYMLNYIHSECLEIHL